MLYSLLSSFCPGVLGVLAVFFIYSVDAEKMSRCTRISNNTADSGDEVGRSEYITRATRRMNVGRLNQVASQTLRPSQHSSVVCVSEKKQRVCAGTSQVNGQLSIGKYISLANNQWVNKKNLFLMA